MTHVPLELEIRKTFYGNIILIPTITNNQSPRESTISRAAIRVFSDPPGQFRLVTSKIDCGEVRLVELYCYRKDGPVPTWYTHIKPQFHEWKTTVEDDYTGMHHNGSLEFQALEVLLQA